MPRRGRITVPDVAHHITQRGNNRLTVFDSEGDRRVFLNLLGKYSVKYDVSILGYCLMPNHFHLVAVPGNEDSLARAIGRLEADYARYLNVRRDACGHLWQSRFFSVPMDPQYRTRALAYIERNPVRAGIAARAEDYAWSSAAARLGVAKSPEWLCLDGWRHEWTASEWRRLLDHGSGEALFRVELKTASFGGHPLGEELTARLEWQLGRPLRPGKIGRPRKWARKPVGSDQLPTASRKRAASG